MIHAAKCLCVTKLHTVTHLYLVSKPLRGSTFDGPNPLAATEPAFAESPFCSRRASGSTSPCSCGIGSPASDPAEPGIGGPECIREPALDPDEGTCPAEGCQHNRKQNLNIYYCLLVLCIVVKVMFRGK